MTSGAKFSIYVSPYTPAFGDCASAYEHNKDRFNGQHQVADNVTSIAIGPIPDGFDIVMTHGPPKGILDWCPEGNVGENILRAVRRVKPLMHCFGHIHESHGTKIVDWKKSATNEPQHQKKVAVHRHFEEDWTVNPYPRLFECKQKYGERTLAVIAAFKTADNRPDNAHWLINLELALLSISWKWSILLVQN